MDFPKNPIPKGIEKRESHLYSITGLITHDSLDGGCVAFGGYFRYDLKTNKICDGQLIDLWGESEIINFGYMDKKILEFDKRYRNRQNIIHYKFKKNEKGIWIGEYNGESAGKGLTHCVTFLADDDAFQIGCGRPDRDLDYLD